MIKNLVLFNLRKPHLPRVFQTSTKELRLFGNFFSTFSKEKHKFFFFIFQKLLTIFFFFYFF